jgi:RNA polymerase-binding transcription factor DksA
MSLNQRQNATLEHSLDRIEQGVRAKIHETMPLPAGEKYANAAGTVNDFGDEAAASTEQDFKQVLHERYLRELQEIEAVRRRLSAGEADRCAECGEEIGYERLLAYPFATRCVECQARYEKFGA